MLLYLDGLLFSFDIILLRFTQYYHVLVQLNMYYFYSVRTILFYPTVSIPCMSKCHNWVYFDYDDR